MSESNYCRHGLPPGVCVTCVRARLADLEAENDYLRAALADAAQKAGEYAHWARGRIDGLEAERDRLRQVLSSIEQLARAVPDAAHLAAVARVALAGGEG